MNKGESGKSFRLIETQDFPFEFVSTLAERESWRKEIYRPIYHVHKWWAKRLGSVFRAILLGSALHDHESLEDEFYNIHDFQIPSSSIPLWEVAQQLERLINWA
ncbi:MAG: hypothetical protein M5U34_08925 [Chloroflexi bacterium]|nr:hypothetical protein [Chloroflexota bacterium]